METNEEKAAALVVEAIRLLPRPSSMRDAAIELYGHIKASSGAEGGRIKAGEWFGLREAALNELMELLSREPEAQEEGSRTARRFTEQEAGARWRAPLPWSQIGWELCLLAMDRGWIVPGGVLARPQVPEDTQPFFDKVAEAEAYLNTLAPPGYRWGINGDLYGMFEEPLQGGPIW